MNRNVKMVAIFLAIAVVVVTTGYFLWHMYLRRPVTVSCADGPHSTIDTSDFTKRYWTYSVKLETSVADKAKISAELDPKMLQQISEALQEIREFSKVVVAGYDSCAITEGQFARYGIHAYAADSVAQEIDSLLSKQSMSPNEKPKLAALINQYSDMVRRLGTD